MIAVMKLIETMRRRAARYLDIAAVTIAPPGGVLSLSFDDVLRRAPGPRPGRCWSNVASEATYCYVCGGLAGGVNMDRDQFRVEHLSRPCTRRGMRSAVIPSATPGALRMSGEALRLSLDANAAWVAERLDGYRMATFTWPFGDATIGAKRVVRERFTLGRGVRDGVNAGREDRGLIKSIGLESRRLPDYDLEALMAEAAATQGWLTAYGHDVSDRPTDYGCTVDDLDRVLRLAKAAGLEVLPFGAAWTRVAQ